MSGASVTWTRPDYACYVLNIRFSGLIHSAAPVIVDLAFADLPTALSSNSHATSGRWLDEWNDKPLVWTKTTDEILETLTDSLSTN